MVKSNRRVKSIIWVYFPNPYEKLCSQFLRLFAVTILLTISCAGFHTFSDADMLLPSLQPDEAKSDRSRRENHICIDDEYSGQIHVRNEILRVEEKKGKLLMITKPWTEGDKIIAQTAPLIMIIGASFVEGWDVSKIDRFVVVNKGVSGETSSDMLVRFDRDVVPLGPRYVIIWGFINDIHRSERNTISATLERTRTNFKAMVNLSRKNGVIPILATELTIFGCKTYIEKIKTFLLEKVIGKESYRAYVNKHVLQVNEWLKSYAREERLMIVDFNRALSGKDSVRKEKYTTPDGTHISSEGYQELTRYIKQALKDGIR
jgi:lysophospholipase L1-like esterase